MKNKKILSIKSRMICLTMFCWFLPLIIIMIFNIYYLSGDRFNDKVERQIEQLKFNDNNTIHNIDAVVDASRMVSYDGELMDLYERYKDEKIPKHNLVSDSLYYLRDNFSRNDLIRMALLWYSDDPENMICSTYNTGEGGTYSLVKQYWNEDHEEIKKKSEELDTRIMFHINGDKIYVVRNVYTPSYENAATLVLLLNNNKCFESYETYTTGVSATLVLDGEPIQVLGKPVTAAETGLEKMGGRTGYKRDNKLKIYHNMKAEEHTLVSLVRFDDSSEFFLFYGYQKVFVMMLFCIIPLMLFILTAFSKQVAHPIEVMMNGAKKIEEGELGYKLDYKPESTEFQVLADSFNTMSERLKYQFDHIYEEEIALRDARIMALQSHINPHFMNNTLEIINWEARLSGNEKVSNMIGALSTLMDAGIDRKKRPEIKLREEMVSVDAYLYIISERFGDKVKIHKNIPEEIMDCMVPRLILQPIIENAVDHGVSVNGKGDVTLTGYTKDNYLYLEIENEALLTKKDLEKISRLLDVNYDTSKESSGNLGIANVNQRLKILYGDTCGLFVEQKNESTVCTRLSILINKEIEKE